MSNYAEHYHLPSGEFAEMSGSDEDGWTVVYWPTEADYRADMAEGGDWYDRATVSVACLETRADALAEIGPASTHEHYELAGRDAGLGVGHIWYRVACPAYTTYNPADCTCKEVAQGSD